MVLNIGPQHPATHGVLRLKIVVDGERIVSAEPVIGYMHRGAEKLFEVRDYRQIIVLANRHDWLSAWCWASSRCSAWRCRSERSGPGRPLPS
jgi:NADH-quinone oxidoreductase subunit D